MGHWEVTGVDRVNAQFDELAARVNAATDAAVDDVLEFIDDATTAALSLLEHPPFTPTPSAPGEPPARIGGALAASMEPTRDPGGDGVYSGRIGPTAVYARIQELGGTIVPRGHPYLSWLTLGDDGLMRRVFAHEVTLPPRPYLKPTVENSKDAVRDIFKTAWDDALDL